MAKKPHKRVPKSRKANVIELPATTRPVKDWKEKWIIFSWLAAPVIVVVILLVLVSKAKWRKGLDNQLAHWKITYRLNDNVVEQIRRIELDFHGSGNPITTPIHHTAHEIMMHHNELADLMAKEERGKFLRDYATGRLAH